MGNSIIREPAIRVFDQLEPFDAYGVVVKRDGRSVIVDALYDKLALAEHHLKTMKLIPDYAEVEIVVETFSKLRSLEQIKEQLSLESTNNIAQTTGQQPHVWITLAKFIG